MDASAQSSPAPVVCPRCDYDQRGEIAKWTDSCPLDGLCTECGLTFAWSRLYANARHPWLFEHQWRRAPLRSALKTIGMCFRPFRFWRDIELTDRICLWPAAVLLFALTFVYLVAVWQHSTAYYWTAMFAPGSFLRGASGAAGVSTPLLKLQLIGLQQLLLPAFASFLTLFLVPSLFVMSFLAMPITLSRARVIAAHLIRIYLYSLVLPLILNAALACAAACSLYFFDGELNQIRWLWFGWDASVMFPPTLAGVFTMPFFYLNYFAPPWLLLMTLWTLAWWRSACTRYLCIPQPTLTVALLGLTSFLASSFLAYGLWSYM